MIIYHITCRKESNLNGIQTPSSKERKYQPFSRKKHCDRLIVPLRNTLNTISETHKGFSVLKPHPQKRQAPCVFYTPKEIYKMQLVYSEAHRVVIPFHLEKFCTFSLELC